MKVSSAQAKKLLRLKAKFAVTSGFATAVDLTIFYFLKTYFMAAVPANIISYSCSVLLNFLLQRFFIFELNRTVSAAFKGSLLVSFGGMLLSTGIIYGLHQYAFFQENSMLAKFIATGIVFFYNFYLKRYVFEKKFV